MVLAATWHTAHLTGPLCDPHTHTLGKVLAMPKWKNFINSRSQDFTFDLLYAKIFSVQNCPYALQSKDFQKQ